MPLPKEPYVFMAGSFDHFADILAFEKEALAYVQRLATQADMFVTLGVPSTFTDSDIRRQLFTCVVCSDIELTPLYPLMKYITGVGQLCPFIVPDPRPKKPRRDLMEKSFHLRDGIVCEVSRDELAMFRIRLSLAGPDGHCGVSVTRNQAEDIANHLLAIVKHGRIILAQPEEK